MRRQNSIFFVTFKKFKKGSYISEFLKIKQKSF